MHTVMMSSGLHHRLSRLQNEHTLGSGCSIHFSHSTGCPPKPSPLVACYRGTGMPTDTASGRRRGADSTTGTGSQRREVLLLSTEWQTAWRRPPAPSTPTRSPPHHIRPAGVSVLLVFLFIYTSAPADINIHVQRPAAT